MQVRAKFVVQSIEDTGNNPENGKTIRLHPVTNSNQSAENAEFFKYTPSGEIFMLMVNPVAAEQFEVGKAYYVDFTPAPAQ